MPAIFKQVKILLTALVIISVATSCRKAENKTDGGGIDEQIEKSLNDFENRKRYSSFSAETLNQIPDDMLETAILDYIADVKIKNNCDMEYGIVMGMSRGFRDIYITWVLESEVNNGGFIQFFYNTSGRFNGEIAGALNDIKAYKTEKIAIDALALYNKDRTIHKNAKRARSMESFMDSYSRSELDRLDDLFYNSREDLSKLRIRYIRENSGQFITKQEGV